MEIVHSPPTLENFGTLSISFSDFDSGSTDDVDTDGGGGGLAI